MDCIVQGHRELDMTERLSLSREALQSSGEGNGYLVQYSGLENSMDYSPWGCKESDT